ncbi:MAG: hypothetical protein K2X94_00085 [Amoebophilaceae bacterium]|nr:hypothetical protein [Amoebophilaceae bacterium]
MMKRYIIGLFFMFWCVAPHRSKAMGFELGPSVGMMGYAYVPLNSVNLEEVTKNKVKVRMLGYQAGLFTKLDVGILYVKPTLLVRFDQWKGIDTIKKYTRKSITIPIEVGVSLFGMVRPHLGLIFDIPLNGMDGIQPDKVFFKKLWNKKTGVLLGFGVDFVGILLDVEFEKSFSRVRKKDLTKDPKDKVKDDKVKDKSGKFSLNKWSVRVGYNLLGLTKLMKDKK